MKNLLALAQHLELDVFKYDTPNGTTEYYIGSTQDDFDELENELLNIQNLSREETDARLKEWIDENATLLEDEIIESSHNSDVLEYGSQEYLVVDDYTADKLWDESLENYIDECILPEMPESIRNYFDNEAWKRDARYDGRGHSLNYYDGTENEETVQGETFYIFRQN